MDQKMDFSYSQSQQEYRQELQDWLETNLPDGWTEGNQQLPKDDERTQFLLDWQQKLSKDRWVGIHWPEEYGGRGASLIEQEIYQEEIAKANAPPIINRIGISFVGPTLVAAGTEAQKERFVPNILNAEEIWCQGYSEPGSGSDIASLTTRAEKEGEQWVINGQKIWTSYAHLADWCFLVTRTDSSGRKHEGITCLLVDMNQDGVSTQRIHQASDKREFNQVYFDDATTPEDMVVGDVNKGWQVVMTLSGFEHSSTQIHSIEQRYLDIVEYCKEETRNGKSLIADERIRQQLAKLDARIQAGKVSHQKNISKRMTTGSPGPEGSMDMLISDEITVDLENFAMNVLGPEASLWEDGHDEGMWAENYIGSYGGWIAAGTGDVQRNIIGERVLGLPKDIKSEKSHRE